MMNSVLQTRYFLEVLSRVKTIKQINATSMIRASATLIGLNFRPNTTTSCGLVLLLYDPDATASIKQMPAIYGKDCYRLTGQMQHAALLWVKINKQQKSVIVIAECELFPKNEWLLIR